ncbi:cyclic nucleotide-binding domain-containing protein [uncultured Methylobacterium sp.]|uniref:cyclic nucleotide-binding domain-containing protein n=1 Tax=uncultured Methylobacterium sp. TaxID=157278 RepID=UPI0035CC035C
MTLDIEVLSLRQVPLFREVELSRLKLLAFTSERVHFDAEQPLFAQGDPADAAYLILDGSAAVTIDGTKGPFQLAVLGPNALVGEMGILADQPRSATVTAQTATMALRISRAVFLELLAQFPQISIAVMRELALRLEQTNQQLAESRG